MSEELKFPPTYEMTYLADLLDDIEGLRKASNNRFGALTRDKADKDGVVRGPGLRPGHPVVETARALKDELEQVEKHAIRELQKMMEKHPLGPFVKQQKGWGYKQIGRLLAAVGDPYIHPDLYDEDGNVKSPEGPRTVSQLWALCGLHTRPDENGAWTAARRKRGEQSNWSTVAKMRAWNVATSIVKTKGEWRDVYDKRRENTAGRVHVSPCVRCGPSGNPAQPGSPWSAGHQHADALRIVSKEVLRALWRESKRLHELE